MGAMGTYMGDVALDGGVASVGGFVDGLKDLLETPGLRCPGGHGWRRMGEEEEGYRC